MAGGMDGLFVFGKNFETIFDILLQDDEAVKEQFIAADVTSPLYSL